MKGGKRVSQKQTQMTNKPFCTRLPNKRLGIHLLRRRSLGSLDQQQMLGKEGHQQLNFQTLFILAFLSSYHQQLAWQNTATYALSVLRHHLQTACKYAVSSRDLRVQWLRSTRKVLSVWPGDQQNITLISTLLATGHITGPT